MPELPEVETVASDLNRRISGLKIIGFWSDYPKAVKQPSYRELTKKIKGARIKKITRRAKNVLIYLDVRRVEYILLIHQKMTGHLLVGKWKIENIKRKKRAVSLEEGPLKEKVNSYIHHIFYLSRGKMLGFSDARKFGKIVLGEKNKIEESVHLSNIGPEPLSSSFTLTRLREILRGKRRKIKDILMDQRLIAGIGNIYSDEILYEAGINPRRRACDLGGAEASRLFKAVRKILRSAVRLRGTSVSDFRDTEGKKGFYGSRRLVYGRRGLPCPRCKRPIERIRIAGRSAHYCPNCQKES